MSTTPMDWLTWLKSWLETPTVEKDLPDTVRATVQVDTRVIDGVKLHFFHRDQTALCLQLKSDGTWNWTVGQ